MKENARFLSSIVSVPGALSLWKFLLAFTVAVFCLVQPLVAQNVAAGPRYALVIGNGSYAELGKLKNPTNDAADMAAALRKLGFDVELLVDADLVSMENGVNRLGAKLAAAPRSMGFFFYAGHGIQSNGINYLIPSDTRISGEAYLRTKALAAQSVLDTFQDAKNGLNVVVLDACRDNPFGWARSGTRGLSVVGSQPTGSIVVYATSAGSVARDGSGRNGVFTQELLKHLQTPDLEIKEVFNRTGAAVQAATSGGQVPAVYNQFFGSAYLAGASPPTPIKSPRMSTAGNLVIISNERAVRVVIDGVDKGALGPGVFRDLAAGERWLELVGKDLYFSKTVTIEPEETTYINAKVAPIGSIEVHAPADARIRIRGEGYDTWLPQTSVLSNVPVGTYRLEASGSGYFSASSTVSVRKGEKVVWEPYTTGIIAFEVLPEGTTCSLSGMAAIPAVGMKEDIAPGKYRAALQRPGHREAEVEATVVAGKVTTITTTLVPFAPGAIVLPRLGVDVELEVEGRRLRSRVGLGGEPRYEVPSGYPLTVKFVIPGAESAVPDATVILEEGETVILNLPSGRFTLPWLALGASVSIQGRRFPAESQEGFRSPPLPVGTYQVSVSGKHPFDGKVTVNARQEIEVPGYRDGMVTVLSAERAATQKSLSTRKARTAWGFVSLGTGFLGAAGAITAYALGAQAGEDYSGAEDTGSAQSAREKVELYGALFPAAAVVGGLGLGLSPILLFRGADPKALERSIGILDEQIRALREGVGAK